MDSEDEPSLLQADWDREEDKDGEAGTRRSPTQEPGLGGVWRAVGWAYSQRWACGLVLGAGVLLPCVLSAYMFLHCPPLDIDLSYSAFEVRSHVSAQRFDALTMALKSQLGSWDRHRREADDYDSRALRDALLERLGQDGGTFSEGAARGALASRTARSVAGAPYYMQSQAVWKMELVFLAQGEKNPNIFTPERLRTIHHVERLVMQHPQFHHFCWKPLEILKDLPLGPSYCSPPSSLLSYLFPSERGGKIYYDGMGPDLANIHGALSLAITHPQFYWYVDETLTPDSLRSSLLRSEIHFGAPLPSFFSLQDRMDEQKRRFRSFVVQYADILGRQSTSQVKVLYGGTELFDDEVRRTFRSDMLLALISGGCIAVLVYILTSFSVFLTVFGLASIGLSCLLALFLYHVVFGVRYLGILNGVAAFIIVGIGVDDVFVFIGTFRQAHHIAQPEQRIVYTVKTAGRATFLTSFTTAAAYAANTFSQIPAVHDFGLFMALIVSCCWLWVSLMMPAALSVWSRYLAHQEITCMQRCRRRREPLTGYAPLSDQDDDIALLSVEMESGSFDSESDAPMVSLQVEMSPQLGGRGETGVVSSGLQVALRRWVAEPVVENRKVVIGVYVLVLLVSAGFCCLLRPASRAPLLFRPETNLQTLLGLRSNLSAQAISCHMCSGLFMEKPHLLHRTPRPCHSPVGTDPGGETPNPANSAAQSSGKHNTGRPQTGPLCTVYVSKLDVSAAVTLYRFSLNASAPSPWKPATPGDGEVPSFQAFSEPHSNFSTRMTVCVFHVTHDRWMITSQSCDLRAGWRPQFSFYVASSEQQNSRKLYFAQLRRSPFPSRVCAAPPGCAFSAGPDGPTKGSFYTPHRADSPAAVSKTSDFDPCGGGGCGRPAVRPLVDTGAMVFVVFGILGVNRSHQPDNHVIGDLGSVVYDPDFDLFKEIGPLCRLCKAIGGNARLVKRGGAQCLPSGNSLTSLLPLLHPDCQGLPQPNLLPGQLSHGAVGMQGGTVRWLSMAFESVSDGLRRPTAHLSAFVCGLTGGHFDRRHCHSLCEPCSGVESALYSLLLSLAICIAAVSVFTAHPLLLLPILLTILGVICLVVAVMYWLGWEMGAVEAISLSILVGSSIDYCLHLVEGFLLAGALSRQTSGERGGDASKLRQQRTLVAVDHVGVAIVSSAVTTVISTVPLFFCVIVPFAKFGQIVAINTAASIFFTLTVSAALLAALGPARFTRPPGAVLKAGLAVVAAVACGAALCWAGRWLWGPVGWNTT
ncbi:hypothetical protein GN956_G19313 [Arapaima gigas]